MHARKIPISSIDTICRRSFVLPYFLYAHFMPEICHQVLQVMTGHHRHHGSTPAFANGKFFVTKCQCLSFRPVGRTRRHHRHLIPRSRRFPQQQRAQTHLKQTCLLFDQALSLLTITLFYKSGNHRYLGGCMRCGTNAHIHEKPSTWSSVCCS